MGGGEQRGASSFLSPPKKLLRQNCSAFFLMNEWLITKEISTHQYEIYPDGAIFVQFTEINELFQSKEGHMISPMVPSKNRATSNDFVLICRGRKEREGQAHFALKAHRAWKTSLPGFR